MTALNRIVAGMVTPLVWHKSHITGWNGDYHTAPTGYTVRCADENGWKWQCAGAFGYANSPEAAMSQAQADYTARILAAVPMLAEVVEALAVIKEAAENRDSDACYEIARAIITKLETKP